MTALRGRHCCFERGRTLSTTATARQRPLGRAATRKVEVDFGRFMEQKVELILLALSSTIIWHFKCILCGPRSLVVGDRIIECVATILGENIVRRPDRQEEDAGTL